VFLSQPLYNVTGLYCTDFDYPIYDPGRVLRVEPQILLIAEVFEMLSVDSCFFSSVQLRGTSTTKYVCLIP